MWCMPSPELEVTLTVLLPHTHVSMGLTVAIMSWYQLPLTHTCLLLLT